MLPRPRNEGGGTTPITPTSCFTGRPPPPSLLLRPPPSLANKNTTTPSARRSTAAASRCRDPSSSVRPADYGDDEGARNEGVAVSRPSRTSPPATVQQADKAG